MNETTSTIDANRTESYCDITELAAFHLGFYQQVNRIICFILGIPLNIFVLVVVVRSRQLWAPRNIFWLGITLFNSIAEVDSIMELTTNYLYQRSDGSHRLVCQIFSTQFGLPYSLLTAGLTLATCDRYLALARHRFYQKHANTKNAVWILIFTFVVVTGVGLSPYWTGIYSVECGNRYEWVMAILSFNAILSVFSLAVQTALYFFVRKCLRYTPATEPIRLEPIHRLHTPVCSMNGEEIRSGGSDNSRKNRIEMRAACILALGNLPFCLINLTLCVCALVVDLKSPGLFNSSLMTVVAICRELIRLHFIYVPVVFATQSSEFRSATKRLRRTKRTPSADELN